MKRFLATYTLVPGRGLLKNHVTTLDDEGRFISCLPLTKELPHTRFISHTLALLAAGQPRPPELTTLTISTLSTLSTLFAAMPLLEPGTAIVPL